MIGEKSQIVQEAGQLATGLGYPERLSAAIASARVDSELAAATAALLPAAEPLR